MAATMGTSEAKEICKRRQAIIEPVFGQLFERKGRNLNYRGEMAHTGLHPAEQIQPDPAPPAQTMTIIEAAGRTRGPPALRPDRQAPANAGIRLMQRPAPRREPDLDPLSAPSVMRQPRPASPRRNPRHPPGLGDTGDLAA